MSTAISREVLPQLGVLLRAERASLRTWCERREVGRFVFCFGVIIVGAGLYGGAMGSWRGPLQALFVAVKFPLIILLTTIGNALLNAILAPLLGLNLDLRRSFAAVLMSFAITAAILGSFSPLVGFVVWNASPMRAGDGGSATVYGSILLTHVVVIAFAGIVGNLRLRQLLCELSGNAATARRVLVSWLAVNLLLGSQLSWILRPFIGSPILPVQFLRATALNGNFFEAVFHMARRVLGF